MTALIGPVRSLGVHADTARIRFGEASAASWNDAAQVGRYEVLLKASSAPTAVAVLTLDICRPADADESRDDYAHWALTHVLLDGHH
ncbi:hypothetical protein [Phytoactinopolyspora halotolerans]|uniref:Uncharacterized protein n=1 Tax=Phytoactinopolyspora halotolerans TaxID=1981512 RepID=A0A6L9S912_9ACTN|nr:hypothetical protein [Phytoactinopolyspora halotolerans]NEE01905.1 hypothetical protein [Phytoactinopolyspora halotolerans]